MALTDVMLWALQPTRHYEVFTAPPLGISQGYRDTMAQCMHMPYLKPGVSEPIFPAANASMHFVPSVSWLLALLTINYGCMTAAWPCFENQALAAYSKCYRTADYDAEGTQFHNVKIHYACNTRKLCEVCIVL